MRDLRPCSLPTPNGVAFREKHVYPVPSPSPSPSPLPTSSPELGLISDEAWERAEMTTEGILLMIRPTLVADQKRQKIIQYVEGLLGFSTGCQFFPYGSVPLRTYLPDGDIDLTAFTTIPNADDFLVSTVHNLLMGEEHNEAAHYKVKDVHRIDAEVKLVKCIVEDIVVDISFNQLGGLSTLCFLEQVDLLTGRDHLFKRSIILIKAWCYYESRILGAHHGLISTYALETLVLYIFHRFHNSFKGPLGALYTFLDYFSKFDWDNYCVSLKGPVCKSSLPDIVAKTPKSEKDLLLSEEFLQSCQDLFSLSFDGWLETNMRAFPLKHLNIIDPLKENNNLGRSVNRGNFYRIRSAFKYGARKLGWILSLPEERIAAELNKFFANTMDGHGFNCWKNVQDSTQASGVKVLRSQADMEFTDSAVLDDPRDVSKNVGPIEKDITGIFGSDEAQKFLLNLRGDYHNHNRNLKFSQFFHLCSTSPWLLSSPPSSPLIQNKKLWKTVHESSAFTQPVNPQSSGYGVSTGPQSYPTNNVSIFSAAFEEENRRHGTGRHGTGTYIPNSICRPYRDRQLSGRGSRGHVPLERHTHTNGLATASPELATSDECRCEVEYPVLESGNFGSSGYHQSVYADTYSCSSEKLEHGSLLPLKVPEIDSGTFTLHSPASSPMASPMQNHRPFLNSDKERVIDQAYHLRNDADFPPLSI